MKSFTSLEEDKEIWVNETQVQFVAVLKGRDARDGALPEATTIVLQGKTIRIKENLRDVAAKLS